MTTLRKKRLYRMTKTQVTEIYRDVDGLMKWEKVSEDVKFHDYLKKKKKQQVSD